MGCEPSLVSLSIMYSSFLLLWVLRDNRMSQFWNFEIKEQRTWSWITYIDVYCDTRALDYRNYAEVLH